MDAQTRLSLAYSSLKDKHVTLQRVRDQLKQENAALKRENEKLWAKLREHHYADEADAAKMAIDYLIKADERL